ncbi:hypothetical protein MRB53_041124 [Persea americana]|nr:hypothetical protein MRB53_041124 [Persea americana]
MFFSASTIGRLWVWYHWGFTADDRFTDSVFVDIKSRSSVRLTFFMIQLFACSSKPSIYSSNSFLTQSADAFANSTQAVDPQLQSRDQQLQKAWPIAVFFLFAVFMISRPRVAYLASSERFLGFHLFCFNVFLATEFDQGLVSASSRFRARPDRASSVSHLCGIPVTRTVVAEARILCCGLVSNMGNVMMATGRKNFRRVRRKRRKKYASRPHFWMKAKFDVENSGTSHCTIPRGGGATRSLSGTRYDRGRAPPEPQLMKSKKLLVSLQCPIPSNGIDARHVCVVEMSRLRGYFTGAGARNHGSARGGGGRYTGPSRDQLHPWSPSCKLPFRLGAFYDNPFWAERSMVDLQVLGHRCSLAMLKICASMQEYFHDKTMERNHAKKQSSFCHLQASSVTLPLARVPSQRVNLIFTAWAGGRVEVC